MKKITLLISVFLMTITISAQETGEDKWGSWAMIFTNNRISDKLSIHAEAQYRNYEFGNNFNQLLLRTALNYDISENAMISFGYGNITTDPTFIDEDIDGIGNFNEHRIYQQLVLRNSVGKLKFSHRYRLEQRFIEDLDTQHRARYFLRVTYPLNEKWFLTAYDEVFINLQEPLFGQNRLYGAVGYNVNANINFQVGYLKNHFTGANFDRFQAALFIKTDLRKKGRDDVN
ncbi:DUF2490 domain-containing protein [Dokdonia sinensis]|nr:DUF2490 domain-containing protein [Dokdonia sinensis]